MMRSDTGLRRGFRLSDGFSLASPDVGAASSLDFPFDRLAPSFGIFDSPLIFCYSLIGGPATAE